MGGLSWIHWVLLIGVALLLFGGGNKISNVMGDFAKGIKAFKKGMTEDDKAEDKPPQKIDGDAKAASTHEKEKDRAAV